MDPAVSAPTKLKLYLAHPFDSRKKVREWELKMEAKYAIDLINPFYDGDRTDVDKLDKGLVLNRTDEENVSLVEGDLKQIKKSQGIVAIVDGARSYGTIMEIVYGGILFGKPVFIIVTNGHINHPWLQVHGTKLFASFKDFERALKGGGRKLNDKNT